ncbi:hypothetical protein [Saccharothrix obliqua]|uniref:hypothetical protein n=1 Tax=Saccharothrix obliqua TaxID=2861747 RepID=UPI001C5D883A|nr:hypothetical protein [Saccharothrix obliqua]MBW4716584.1 hypothetical protein [Saccharothrix obliqua]
MSAETDPRLVEEIDSIATDIDTGVEPDAVALTAARAGVQTVGTDGVTPQGGPYQTHSEPAGGDDPDGGPYQPHEPEPAKTGPVRPAGGPYQTHKTEPVTAQN